MTDWLTIRHGQAPLLVSIPHTGTDIPPQLEGRLVSPWLARKDADWWIERLYDFAADLDATIVRTAISRTVVDVNRDPSGISLYPGQATTELCPTTSFDGEPLYRPGAELRLEETGERRASYFDPYHAALAAELHRLRGLHDRVVLYDCHSIRSVIPRLFDGELPVFNIGTNSSASCAPELAAAVERLCGSSGMSHVINGRFKGGFITRHHAAPERGIHAVQMELACRGYMAEKPGPVSEADWPVPYDETYAAPIRAVLQNILKAALAFARHEGTA
ncbi:N-formylglutamate deformylase [Lichenifustis flavocetrariae]|uniref:N-formylglutamate deformylase n=1 Tax=Lichenifustis flavocetrariae TaxID=2949735 RepID=A0AA42CK23_9HYPH|nr:N-formylglutamate deformylase [Lichenifustis flavocetrariae]MCW6510143.1 N-formylglutamate deformylase [Lichenifustis flavocetrariae]